MTDQIQTLELRIEEATDARQKIDAMNALAWEIRESQTQKAENLSQDALELARNGGKNSDAYQKGIADSLRNLAVIGQRLSNYQIALTSAQEALELYQSLGIPDGEAEALRIIGTVIYHLGNYPDGLDYCLQSVTINEDINNKKGLGRSLISIGSIYSSTSDHDKSLEAYEKSLEISMECNDYLGQAMSYNNIAMAFYLLEDYDKALIHGKKGKRISKDKGFVNIMTNAVCTLGEIYLGKGDQKSASEYFEESLTLSREIEFKFIEFHSLFNLGKIRYLNEDHEHAKDLLMQAKVIAEEIGEKKEESECHELLGKIYEKTLNYERALVHLKKYHQMKNDIFSSKAEAKIRHLEILHETKTAQREKEVKEASESQFQVLFEESPISIWELDWSQLKIHIEELRESGVSDFDAYFKERPEEINTWVNLIQVTNVNKNSVYLFKAKGKETLLDKFHEFIHKDAVEVFHAIFAKFAHGESAAGGRLPTVTFDGDEIFIENLFTIARGYEESWGKVLYSVIDVTERELAKQERDKSEELYRSVSEMANDAIAIIENGVFVYCNPSLAMTLGRETDEVINQPFTSFLHPDTLPEVMEDFQEVMAGGQFDPKREFTVVKKDGEVITIEAVASILERLPNFRVLMIGRDITEQKEFEEKLRELATTDPLTGIANRRHFFELANQELERSQRYGHHMGIILFDIDYFKKVNDEYGHAVGDEALIQLASTCQTDLRSVDLIARYGGEEFVVMLPEMTTEDTLAAAERIRSKLSKKTFTIEDNKIKITVSLGVTSLRLEDKDITMDQLLDQADKALYQSKQAGRNQTTVWEEEKVKG